MRYKIFVTAIITLLIFSSVAAISSPPIDKKSIENGVTQQPEKNQHEQNEQSSDNQVQSNTVQESSNINYKQNNIDTETWYEGETVKTEFKRYKQIPYDYEIGSINQSDTLQMTGTFNKLRENDSNSLTVRVYDDSDDDNTNFRIFFLFKIFTTGTITGRFRADTDVTSPTDWHEGTFEITEDNFDTYVDRNNKLLISLDGGVGTGLGELNSIGKWTADGISGQSFTTGELVSASGFEYSDVQLEELSFTPDIVTSNKRTEYKYTSESIRIHKLDFTVYQKMNVSIYNPSSWDLSTLDPNLDYSYDTTSETYNISVPFGLDLLILFTSNSSNIMAISDVSADYMQSPSFESGTNEDWTGSGFDDEATNTSIVSDGSFSYRLEATSSGTDTLTFNELNPGEYYFSFDYYIESSSYSSLNLQYHDGSTWQSIELDSTTTDRWHTQTEFIHVKNSDYANNLRFSFDSGSGVIFIDNHRLSQSNAQVETFSYNHFKFNYQVVSPDNRKNPSVSNIYTNVTVGDRTSQTDIKTKSCYTDDNGMCSVDWKAGFEPKEYYLKVQTSTNTTYSYFTPLPINSHSYSYEQNGLQSNLNNYFDFSESELEDWYGSGFVNEDAKNGYLNVTTPSDSQFRRAEIGTVSVDVSQYRTLVARVKALGNTQASRIPYYIDGIWNYGVYEAIPNGEYTYLIRDISETSGIITKFYINFANATSGEYSETGDGLHIDHLFAVDRWDQGYRFEFNEPNSFDESTGWNMYDTEYGGARENIEISDGFAYIESTANYGGLRVNFEETQTISSTNIIELSGKHISGTNIRFAFRNQGSAVLYLSGDFANDMFSKITLSYNGVVEYDQLIMWSGGNGSSEHYIDYIRMIDTSQSPNLEVDSSTGLSYFDNGNNSTEYYQTWVNGSNYGIYSEYELFYLPMQASTTYSFTYTTYFSTGNDHVQTASTFYEFEYTIEVDFVISNFNFYLSDTDEFLTFHSTKSGTVTIYHNDTSVDTASIAQGYNTISSSRDLTPGAIIFYAAYFQDNDGNSGWYNTTISNQDPVEEEDLSITALKTPNYDLSSGFVSIYFETNWENTTISVYQNGTSLGSVSEGIRASISFTTDPGNYNFTYVINGTAQSITIEDWYSIIEEIDMTTVHFQFTNLVGVGINFDIARLYINDTRQYNNEYNYEEGTFLNITVKTHFNTTVVQTNTTVTGESDQDVVIIVPLYLQYFNNQNDVPIAVNITSSDYDISFIIDRNESFSMWVISSEYDITIEALQDPENNDTHVLSYESKTIDDIDLPTDDQRLDFSLSLNAEKIEDEPEEVKQIETLFGPQLANFILNAYIVFITLFSIGIAILLYKLVEAGGKSAVVSFYNFTIGNLTGKKMRYRRDILISENKPTVDNEYSTGVGEYTKADENLRSSVRDTDNEFSLNDILNILFVIIFSLVFLALVAIIILTQYQNILSTFQGD